MQRLEKLSLTGAVFGIALGLLLATGCDNKSKSTGGGNSNKSSSTNNAAVDSDSHDRAAPADTDSHGGATGADVGNHDESHEGDDHEGHDHEAHDDEGVNHGDDASPASNGTVADDGLVDLSAIGITRRPSGANPDNPRDATADLIYATVRVKMDVMIAERKQLLDAGLDTTDPEIRKREASINRAIALLEENGETIDPIDPPLTQ